MGQKNFLAIVIIFIMIFSLTACGGDNANESAEAAAVSSAAQQEVIEELAEKAAEVPMPDTQAAASADAAADVNEAESSSIEKLLGDWTDVNDVSRFVKITDNGGQYEYEDVDGKYPGTYKDGILTIKITDAENDTATVFIDVKTGNMVTNYQGDIYEFSRKLD